jgi:hypothetical protein
MLLTPFRIWVNGGSPVIWFGPLIALVLLAEDEVSTKETTIPQAK